MNNETEKMKQDWKHYTEHPLGLYPETYARILDGDGYQVRKMDDDGLWHSSVRCESLGEFEDIRDAFVCCYKTAFKRSKKSKN